MSTMEERLAALEAQMKDIHEEVAKLRAFHELTNLMGRYAAYFGAACGQRILDELWTHEEDAVLEYGASGVYSGQWQLKTYYISSVLPGQLSTVTFSSPEIQIDEEKGTARGIWTAFGTETDAGELGDLPIEPMDNRQILFTSKTADGARYRCEILLQKYEVEFRRENQGWRIIRLHVHEYFRCPYGKDWVQYAKERFETDGVWLETMFETPLPFPPEAHGENLPAKASTSHWQYKTNALPALSPEYPEPF